MSIQSLLLTCWLTACYLATGHQVKLATFLLRNTFPLRHKHMIPVQALLTDRVWPRSPATLICLLLQITHPLSVSYNKLGDLEYGLGKVEAAEGWYQKGLAVRQQALSSQQTAQPSQQLDVAVSMIKVADAHQVCCIVAWLVAQLLCNAYLVNCSAAMRCMAGEPFSG